MERELKRPYPRVWDGARLSYGGSQHWFAEETMRRCGCGVVACADALLYLTGRGELPMEEYRDYANHLRRYFPLIPRRGIDGVRLALGFNACLRGNGLPVRARWCASGERFWPRLSEMLDADLPAVVAIGPNFPRFWDAKTLTLYRETPEGGYAPDSATKAHFVTVTGLDEAWMRVSSWGRRLYVGRAAYERYMRERSGALFTNLLYLKRKEP